MRYTQDFIRKLEPRKPIPTGLKTEIKSVPDIKAVIFDIYGTLLISASGDIEEAEMVAGHILETLDFVGIEIDADKPEETAALILTAFSREIKRLQKVRREEGIKFPEIDIKVAWCNVLGYFAEYSLIPWPIPMDTIGEIAMIFELLSNPVYPMPGMNRLIGMLQARKLPMGIVSNAQFYTPICMNYFLNGVFEESEDVKGFDSDLTVFSYQHQIGKPDTSLFRWVGETLKSKYQIRPSQA